MSRPSGTAHLGHSAVEEIILEVPPQTLAPLSQVVGGFTELLVVELADPARFSSEKKYF